MYNFVHLKIFILSLIGSNLYSRHADVAMNKTKFWLMWGLRECGEVSDKPTYKHMNVCQMDTNPMKKDKAE